MTKLLLTAILYTLAMLVPLATAQAECRCDYLYAADGYINGGNDPQLYRISTGDGSATVVGAMGLAMDSGIVGLAMHPATNEMYAVGSSGPATFHYLYKINLSTGEAILQGNGGGITANITDISFDDTGVLYGWNNPNNLITIGLDGDSFTSLGSDVYIDEFLAASVGLAFRKADGDLYLKPQELQYRIDKTNGIIIQPGPKMLGVFVQAMMASDSCRTMYSGLRNTDTNVFNLYSFDATDSTIIPTTLVGFNPYQYITALECDHRHQTPLCLHGDSLLHVPGADGGTSLKRISGIRTGDYVLDEHGAPVEVLGNVISGATDKFVRVEAHALGPQEPATDVLFTGGHLVRDHDGAEVIVETLVGKNARVSFVSLDARHKLYNLVTPNRTFFQVSNMKAVSWAKGEYEAKFGGGYTLQ